MSVKVHLHHQTTYDYDRLVKLGAQIIRLHPSPHSRTPIVSYQLRVDPAAHFLNWQQDPIGNSLARVFFPSKIQHLHVSVEMVANIVAYNPFDFYIEPYAATFPFSYQISEARELMAYLVKPEVNPSLIRWVQAMDLSEKQPIIGFLVSLNQKVCESIHYLLRLTPGVQTLEETLEKGSGSCRDTAWLMIETLRHLGMAARFVSGYLIQLKTEKNTSNTSSKSLARDNEYDVAELHAWCEVYLPGAGWIGFDTTSGLLSGEGHIPLAYSCEPESAAPISGSTEPCQSQFHHHIKVSRI